MTVETSGSRTALIAGATGLVGSHLLDELLALPLYLEVRALVRRPLGREHPKLTPVTADSCFARACSWDRARKAGRGSGRP